MPAMIAAASSAVWRIERGVVTVCFVSGDCVYDDIIGGGSGAVFSVPIGTVDGALRSSGVTRVGVPEPGFMFVVQPNAASDAARVNASSVDCPRKSLFCLVLRMGLSLSYPCVI